VSAGPEPPNAVLVGVVLEARLASGAAGKEDTVKVLPVFCKLVPAPPENMIDDVWDAPDVAGTTAPPSFTSPTTALT
jgi:hypothetical protein